jgi:hypothetical protein
MFKAMSEVIYMYLIYNIKIHSIVLYALILAAELALGRGVLGLPKFILQSPHM